jgi:hypothetical protein
MADGIGSEMLKAITYLQAMHIMVFYGLKQFIQKAYCFMMMIPQYSILTI